MVVSECLACREGQAWRVLQALGTVLALLQIPEVRLLPGRLRPMQLLRVVPVWPMHLCPELVGFMRLTSVATVPALSLSLIVGQPRNQSGCDLCPLPGGR